MPSKHACLHIISRPLSPADWQHCANVLGPNCAIVLLQGLVAEPSLPAQTRVYQLQAETASHAEQGATLLDYAAFVELAASFGRSRTW